MDGITVTVAGRRATITLDRTERRNAITPGMLAALVDACEELAEADVVVLRSASADFSVGFDLDHFDREDDVGDGAHLGGRAVAALAGLGGVTVAAMSGWVVGGGVALAGACDLRLATHDTRFRIPEVPLGIPLGWGAMPILVAELGPSVAKDLVMTGRDMDAEEARQRGFVARVVHDLDAATDALVDRLLSTLPGPLRTTKQQVAEAASIAATGTADAALLLEAAGDPAFRDAFERYRTSVRGDG